MHPSIEVEGQEEGVEEGEMVTADAVIVTLVSLGGEYNTSGVEVTVID